MPPRKQILRRARDPRRLLAELIALPSVHPEAAAGGTRPGEAAVAAWLADRLRRLGAGVTLRPLAPGRPNVVGVFAPVRRARATVLLMPHLDTVGVAGMSVPPFRLTRGPGGRLHGRGACDTKGPTAALLAALAAPAVQRRLATGEIRWIVAATAGEEQGSLGATALFAAGLRADFAIALEPTDLQVVHAAKGLLRVWLEVRGKAAHGSRPDRGVNAAYRALPLLAAIRDELAPWLAAHHHPVLGAATVNVGIVEAGTELNIVPARCRLGLDLRLHPGVPQPVVLRQLRALIRRHAPGGTLTIQCAGPAFVTPRHSPWAAQLGAVARGWKTADWFCDANVAARSGVPGVAFGPGSIRQAHTRDEYITERALDAGCAAFGRFLTDAAPSTSAAS
jgi:acetylornithine deacetylase/succinyl-diaminopimelate desuccinylase-like protein